MAIKYFTKSEARAAAKTATVVKSARQIIMESHRAASDSDKFDVFLSHAKVDADLVLGVKKILEREGKSVYVDWENDAQTCFGGACGNRRRCCTSQRTLRPRPSGCRGSSGTSMVIDPMRLPSFR
jgi:hypothetical protein